jgi:hypothetical protein
LDVCYGAIVHGAHRSAKRRHRAAARDKARAQQQYCDAPLLRGTVAIRSAMAE